MGSVARSIISNRLIKPYTEGDKAAAEDRKVRAKCRETAEAEISKEIKDEYTAAGHQKPNPARVNKRARVAARYKDLCTAKGIGL